MCRMFAHVYAHVCAYTLFAPGPEGFSSLSDSVLVDQIPTGELDRQHLRAFERA